MNSPSDIPGDADGPGLFHEATKSARRPRALAQEPAAAARVLANAEPVDIEWARQWMNRHGRIRFFGAAEIENAFPGLRIDPRQVPPAPPAHEIRRHAALGDALYLRVPAGDDGMPLTIERMERLLWQRWMYGDPPHGRDEFMKYGYLLSIRGTDERREPYFAAEAPRLGWAFAADGLLEDSDDVGYVEQTTLLAAFAGKHLSSGSRDIRAAVTAYPEELRQLRYTDAPAERTAKLTRMKINMLLRATAAETFYDALVMFANSLRRGKPVRLLEREAAWTTSTDSEGLLVAAGMFDDEGMRLAGVQTTMSQSRSRLGTRLSRLFPA